MAQHVFPYIVEYLFLFVFPSFDLCRREAVPLNPLLHTSVCSALSLPLWSIDRPRPVANGIQKTSGSLSRSYLYVTFFCSASAHFISPSIA